MGGGDERGLLSPLVAAGMVGLAGVASFTAAPRRRPAAAPRPSDAGHDPERFQTSHNCVACHNGLITPSGEDVSIGARLARVDDGQLVARSRTGRRPSGAKRSTIPQRPRDRGRVLDLPHADGRGPRRGSRAAAAKSSRTCRSADASTPDDEAGRRRRVVHALPSDRSAEAWARARASRAASIVEPAPGEPRRMFGPFDGRRRPHRADALGDRRDAGRGDARPRVGDVRDVPHALHPGARAAGQADRSAARAGAVPRVAPQRVPRPTELPGLPHARVEQPSRSRRCSASCATGQPPYVSRRQLLHAAHAEPLSGGAGRRGAAARARRGRRRDRSAAAVGDGGRVDRDVAPEPGDRLRFEVSVTNMTGHKLPTGYPSRRAWLHVMVRDAAGRTVFESGAVDARGAIAGNDHDEDPLRVEPHYDQIDSAEQVQMYESVMADIAGAVTTGLLRGLRIRQGQPPAPGRLRQAHGGQRHRSARTGGGGRELYRRRRSRDLQRRRRRGCRLVSDPGGAPLPAHCVQMGPQSRELRRGRDAPVRLVLRRDGGRIIHRPGEGGISVASTCSVRLCTGASAQ